MRGSLSALVNILEVHFELDEVLDHLVAACFDGIVDGGLAIQVHNIRIRSKVN